MSARSINESELAEILKLVKDGEEKLKQMSDYATIASEKWRVKTHNLKTSNSETISEPSQNID